MARTKKKKERKLYVAMTVQKSLLVMGADVPFCRDEHNQPIGFLPVFKYRKVLKEYYPNISAVEIIATEEKPENDKGTSKIQSYKPIV